MYYAAIYLYPKPTETGVLGYVISLHLDRLHADASCLHAANLQANLSESSSVGGSYCVARVLRSTAKNDKINKHNLEMMEILSRFKIECVC
jgi:hypothetical protein